MGWVWQSDGEATGQGPADGIASLDSLVARVVELVRRADAVSSPVVTAADVAAWLHVTPRAVRQMMDRGEIPWAQLGSQRVVVRDQLLAKLTAAARRIEDEGGGR